MLINATTLSVEDIPNFVSHFDGICYPAHIDRQSNGIISVLGTFPSTPYFSCVELHDNKNRDEYIQKYDLQNKKFIVSSDAHYLTQMRDKENYFLLPDNLCDDNKIIDALFEHLR